MLEVQESWVTGTDNNGGCHWGLRDCCSDQNGGHLCYAPVAEPPQERLPLFT